MPIWLGQILISHDFFGIREVVCAYSVENASMQDAAALLETEWSVVILSNLRDHF
jgi:hypothetical protein